MHIFPEASLAGSLITTVWVGVFVICFFNLRCDLHGNFVVLDRALHEINFNPAQDTLLVLGDF